MESTNPTFDLLANTANPMAEALLRAALLQRDRVIVEEAFKTSLRRKSQPLGLLIVERWHAWSENLKKIAARLGLPQEAMQQGLASASEQTVRNAIDAAIELELYEMVPHFVRMAVDAGHPHRGLAAEAICLLADNLHEQLSAPRNYAKRRDPRIERDRFVVALEGAVNKYHRHRRTEILEAFLLLTNRENASLRYLLQDANDPNHSALIEQLQRSTRPGVVALLLTFIDDPLAPATVIQAMSRRQDIHFFRALCRVLAERHEGCIDQNLAKIEHFPWIDLGMTLLRSLHESEQLGVIRMVAKSRASTQQKERLFQYLLSTGSSLAKAAALRAYIALGPTQLHDLLTHCLNHPDPVVQAEAALHLREAEYPNAIGKLLEFLASTNEEQRSAARKALADCDFTHYLSAYESLSPTARQLGAHLVKKVSPHLHAQISAELTNQARARRKRALELVEIFACAAHVEPALIRLTADEDHALRLEAIRLLGASATPDSLATLHQLSHHQDHVVASMAVQALGLTSALPLPLASH